MICSWAAALPKWTFSLAVEALARKLTFLFPQYVKQWALWRILRCKPTDTCWENHTTLHFITKVYFLTCMSCLPSYNSTFLVWFYCVILIESRIQWHYSWWTLSQDDINFSPSSPDLIFSSKHSIFGHTDKKRSIKTTELHFFLGESYLINQRLGWGNKCVLKMRIEPSEKTLRETPKAERHRVEREGFSKSGAATCHFTTMAQNPLGKGESGELFRRPSPLSEWSLQSGPLEFLHHVILFMGCKTQPSEAWTRRRHITTAAICEWRWFCVWVQKHLRKHFHWWLNSEVDPWFLVCKHEVLSFIPFSHQSQCFSTGFLNTGKPTKNSPLPEVKFVFSSDVWKAKTQLMSVKERREVSLKVSTRPFPPTWNWS